MASLPTQISNFFLSMQAGKAGAKSLESAFADDAVYEEPFTGQMRTHEGRAEIMQAMAMGWEQPLVDMTISVDKAEVRGEEIFVDWTCRSPSLPGGQGSGQNLFVMQDGKIQRLVTTLKE